MPSRFQQPPVAPMKTVEANAMTRLESMRQADPLTDAVWRRPTGELPLKLRSLSDKETTRCYAEAIKYFAQEEIDLEKFGPYVADAFEDEVKLQILHAACRDPVNPSKPFANSAEDLRDNTTPIERAVMLLKYNDHVKTTDRSAGEFTPEVSAAIRELIKKKDATSLNAFGSFALVSYLLSTSDQPASSPTTTSDTSD